MHEHSPRAAACQEGRGAETLDRKTVEDAWSQAEHEGSGPLIRSIDEPRTAELRIGYDGVALGDVPIQGRRTVSLEITQRETNGIYVLALRGRLVLGDESNGLRTTVDKLLGSGATRVVVNLEHVDFVDSAGLGALIEAHRKTKEKSGHLKLCHMGPRLKKALELARLLPMFETCSTEAAALAEF